MHCATPNVVARQACFFIGLAAGGWRPATPVSGKGRYQPPSINTYESRAGRIISVVNALCFVQSFNLQSFVPVAVGSS